MALALPLLLSMIWLAWTARQAWVGFHPLDSVRWWFILPPAALASALALLLTIIPLRYCRGCIRLGGDGVSYRGLRFAWEGLKLRHTGHGLGEKLEVSHREQMRTLAVHALFMPGFRELEETLQAQLQRRSQRDLVLSID